MEHDPGVKQTIIDILVFGGVLAVVVALAANAVHAKGEMIHPTKAAQPVTREAMHKWRMTPLAQLQPMVMTKSTRLWMGLLRGYLAIAMVMVAYKVVQLAM